MNDRDPSIPIDASLPQRAPTFGAPHDPRGILPDRTLGRQQREFRHALTGRGGGAGAQASSDSVAAMAGWYRPEPPRAPGGNAVPPARPATVAARVLVGQHAGVAEARIRIAGGALAGTEIRLQGGGMGSHAVEARLLTGNEGSRQTLAVAMDEIRARLQRRGIELVEARETRGRSHDRGGDPDRDRDRDLGGSRERGR